MPEAGYEIELDFFSGLQNPSFEIKKEDFEILYDQVVKLEKTGPVLFFEGLGFRGIILSAMNSTFIYIQNKTIQVETLNGATFFKSNPDIILKAINLFKKYDVESNHKMLVVKVIDEYL